MIGITPYYFQNYKYNNQNKNRLQYKAVLNKDTVSFGSKNILSYSRSKMNELINNSIIQKNFIGAGTEGEVYIIPQTGFCIKIPYNVKHVFEKFTTSVSPKDKVNHTVAIFDNGARIMNYIEGRSLMYRRPPILRFSSENKNVDRFLEKFFSGYPDIQLHKFLKQLAQAKEKNMYFDFSPGNIIYNPENNTLTAIDFFEKNANYDEIHPYSILSRAFLGIKTYMKTPEAVEQNKQLGIKFIKVALNDLQGKNELHLSGTDFEVFFDRFEQSQEQKLPPQYNFLKQSIFDLLELYKSKDASAAEIQGKLKYINCIIRQLEENIT